MKHLLPLIMISLACSQSHHREEIKMPEKGVEVVLDEWHRAAAEGKYEKYFSFFEDSASVFMGTDATERWTVAEFAPWAAPAFEDGKAWVFEPFNRTVYYSDDGSIAWFDEELNSVGLGLLRGTGVLKRVSGEWKIVHYNLALPIPNDIVYDVRDQISVLDSVKNAR